MAREVFLRSYHLCILGLPLQRERAILNPTMPSVGRLSFLLTAQLNRLVAQRDNLKKSIVGKTQPEKRASGIRKRWFSMKKTHPAQGKWERLYGKEKTSVTRQPEQSCRRSRRSEQAGHARGRSAWERQRDGHCEPDATTRRGDNGRAVHASRRDQLGEQAALAERKAARRR